MRVSVLVTTYGRRTYLEGCLKSLLDQARTPDEIVVVTRRGDDESLSLISGLIASYRGPVSLKHAEVSEPGVLAANRVGLPLATGDLICFIDDDAAARPDWIARVERHFAEDASLGALGGRDLHHTAAGIDDEPASVVGRVRWYGRIIGNHHKRLPGCHPAEALKGCNMAFRRFLVTGFDDGIIGNAHYYEMDLCFGVRRAGHKVLYDGDIVVDHYVEAPRHLPGNADPRDPRRFFFLHHNRMFVMLKNLSLPRRVVFLAYSFLSDAAASLMKWAARKPEGRPVVVREIFRGKIEGWRRYRSRRAREAAAPGRSFA